jgi:uncharacterized protein YeeX (DUF496 family)
MITLKLGELYGMKNEKELLDNITWLQSMGMSDEDIQKIIDRSEGDTHYGG